MEKEYDQPMDDLHIAAAKAAEEYMRHNPTISYLMFSFASIFGWIARVMFAAGRKSWIKEAVGFFVVGMPIAAWSGLLAFEYLVTEGYSVRMILMLTSLAIYVGSSLSMNVALWMYDIKIKEIISAIIMRQLK